MWWLLLVLAASACAEDPKITVKVVNPVTQSPAYVTGYLHPYGQSFRGIRYARPPTGSLRFQTARQQDLNGQVSALGYGNHCAHSGTGSEDCLFINVFAPYNTTADSKLPVFFWIHGGGFTGGSGNLGGGMYPNLIDRGRMIIVSINYRLGPFGFFSTRDGIAPGNQGISDCIEALRWVKRYISFFGGDASRVTIGGHSSGAEAVSFITMTRQADGLYSQVIMQSGSAFGAAVMSYSEKTRDTSETLAVRLDCATDEQWQNGEEMGSIVNCLRYETAEKIMAADAKLPGHRMKWAPVQDRTFFPTRLENLALQRKSVPVLAGNAHDEWLAWEMSSIEHALSTSGFTRAGLTRRLANSYEMTYWQNASSVLAAAQRYYISSDSSADGDNVAWAAKTIQLFTEMVFVGPVLMDARYFAFTHSNVYLYSFDYLNDKALPQISQPALRGEPHGWELQYLFGSPATGGGGWNVTADDITTEHLMGDLWSNFINHGNPTPKNQGIATTFTWPTLNWGNMFVSLGPRPVPSVGFHPHSMFWVCDAPAYDGYKPPYCP